MLAEANKVELSAAGKEVLAAYYANDAKYTGFSKHKVGTAPKATSRVFFPAQRLQPLVSSTPDEPSPEPGYRDAAAADSVDLPSLIALLADGRQCDETLVSYGIIRAQTTAETYVALACGAL